MAITRRHFLRSAAAVAACGTSANSLFADPYYEGMPQDFEQVGIIKPVRVNFIEGFEPTSDIWTVEREIGLALDYSSSMDVAEVARSVAGAIDGITQSKLLSGDADSNCQGPIGLLVSIFRNFGQQHGYLVIRSSEQAALAKQTLTRDLLALSSSGNTGVGEGINMLNAMFQGSPFVGRPVAKRMAFLIGDGKNNTGPNPISASNALAENCGVTLHCVEMLKDVYKDVPTSSGITYFEDGFPIQVSPGERVFADNADEIARFMHYHIDPSCLNMAGFQTYLGAFSRGLKLG